MAIPALAVGMILRAIAREGVKAASRKFGAKKVKEAREAAKSPEVRKEAEEAVRKAANKPKPSSNMSASDKRELERIRRENPGPTVRNNTLNRGGMPKKANCGASVPPNRKAKS